MLIKDEDTANIVLGDTLGNGKTKDSFESRKFHYLMANPPFGVEWKNQKHVVEREHPKVGFSGWFGAGLPAIDDGSLLFLVGFYSAQVVNESSPPKRVFQQNYLSVLE